MLTMSEVRSFCSQRNDERDQEATFDGPSYIRTSHTKTLVYYLQIDTRYDALSRFEVSSNTFKKPTGNTVQFIGGISPRRSKFDIRGHMFFLIGRSSLPRQPTARHHNIELSTRLQLPPDHLHSRPSRNVNCKGHVPFTTSIPSRYG